ncbi:MAG: hypothetical protein ACYTG1_01390 [Planctomycetota bacterium]|jgi:hypothetical protein
MTRSILAVAAAAALVAAAAPASPPADPAPPPLDVRGVFLHAWTGTTAGTEWVLSVPAGPGRYRFAGVLGTGATFSLAADGAWRAVGTGETGRGRLLDADHLLFDWSARGQRFSSMARRAPHTTPDFPLAVESPDRGDIALEGSWSCTMSQISPTTGEVLAQRGDQATVTVRGSIFRIAFPDGRFDQGVFETPEQVVFRVCEPPPRDPGFHTVEGCATSRNEDLFGEARIVDPNRIEVLLFRQTRAPVSEQVQFQERYVLTRLVSRSIPSGPG